ncbi:MAG: molybdenum cofactor biosynthesis protein MoaE [Gemmatimonadaceae bacterium]
MSRTAIVTAAIDVAAIVDEVRGAPQGAIVTFIGTVRNSSGTRTVTGLEYSVYAEMANREMTDILHEALALASGAEIVAVHRVGNLDVGEICVMIAASHAHRAAAFDACRYTIEGIKKRVPIWKRERYADGSTQWVAACSDTAQNAGNHAGEHAGEHA